MTSSSAPRPLARIADAADFAGAFDVSRETLDRLDLYVALLKQWQPRINLVAPATIAEVWHRHVADSAQLQPLAPDAPTWLDLGSGAGFPGLVIAIMAAETGAPRVTLVESDARKCAFMREVARQTGIAVDIRNQRIETLATHANVEPFGVVSARALAPMVRLLGMAAPFLGDGTLGLFPKGRDVAQELAAARTRWQFDAELVASRTDADGRIVVVRGLRSATEG